MENLFYDYLISEGYAEKTKSGHPSTAPMYLRSVRKVAETEGFGSLNTLAGSIGSIVALYDKGGVKEVDGKKSKRTVINALKAFQRFCA